LSNPRITATLYAACIVINTTTTSKTPWQYGSRYDSEADDIVQQLIDEENLRISPEEYAARQAHDWMCFSYHLHRFRDPVLGAWVRRFGEILSDVDQVKKCRTQYLTPEEIVEVERRAAEEF